MASRLNTLLARLLLGSGVPVVLFVAVAAVASLVIVRLIEALNGDRDSRELIILGLNARLALDRTRLAAEPLPYQPRAELPRSYAEAREDFTRAVEALGERIDGDARRDRVAALRRREAVWNQHILEGLRIRRQKPDLPPAEYDHRTAAFAERSDRLARDLAAEIDGIVEAESRTLTEREAATRQLTRESVIAIGVALALALLLTLVVCWHVAQGVTGPVERLRRPAGELLAGRFRSVPPAGPAEIAELITHFNHMAMTLSARAVELENEQQRFHTYIGGLTQILWTTGPDGLVNGDLPAWRAFTGQTAKEIVGLGWLDAVHPDERDRAKAHWRDTVRRQAVYEDDYRLRARDGAYRYFAVRGVPIVGRDGTLREWVGTCTDITERKNEAILRAEKEAAESRNRAKSEFLTRMSHELRTPLNAVIGMSKMLSMQIFGPLTAKQSEYVRDITQAGEHLLTLINDILDLAKVEAGRLEVHADSFALNRGVAALLSTLRPLAADKRIRVTFEPAEDGPLHTDPVRFRQLLYNLLSNAIKFTPPGGTVTVETAWVDSPRRAGKPMRADAAPAVRVAVRDTGVGIDPADQAAVWEEFRQVNAAAGPGENPGSGLGLAVTRRLVELLGGEVWLESEPGRGSTFSFALPRRLQTSAGEEPTGEAEGRPLVLVIEDHPPTHRLLIDWLRQAGLRTASAYDGDEGLAKARALRPQLVVLDLFLPKRDGWAVLNELKSDPDLGNVPVVIATAGEDRSPAIGLGVSEFFVKPLDRDCFLERLRDLRPALFGAGGGPALVVEDDPAVRKWVADLLRAEGLRVVEAADGAEALERLRALTPELVVCDLMMPRMDGFAVVDEIRQRPELQNVPILVVTAKELTASDNSELDGRIQAVIHKGWLTPERLRDHLRNLGIARPTQPTG